MQLDEQQLTQLILLLVSAVAMGFIGCVMRRKYHTIQRQKNLKLKIKEHVRNTLKDYNDIQMETVSASTLNEKRREKTEDSSLSGSLMNIDKVLTKTKKDLGSDFQSSIDEESGFIKSEGHRYESFDERSMDNSFSYEVI